MDAAPDLMEADQTPPTPDAGAPDWQAPFTPAVCGATPYSWLPPATMGAVVTKEKSLLFSLNKAALELLIGLSDYGGVVKPLYDVNVYLVRYETQDRGKKVEATMAMAYPTLPKSASQKAPYVLWLHGTSGFSDACAPTRAGADAALPVALMASQGYIGVAPDYIGMTGFGAASTTPHAYLMSEPVALGSLDSLRAAGKVISSLKAPVQPDDRVIVWGGSQGGHAALFSTLYAPYYAPQYTVTATVALIPPANLVRQTEAALKNLTSSTTALAGAVVAQSRWYGVQSQLANVLTDTAPNNLLTALPALMDTKCSVKKSDFTINAVSDIFTTGVIDAVTNKNWVGYEQWKCMAAENSLPDSSVKPKSYPPTFFVVSENDTLVNSSVQRVSFDELCTAGYQLEYLECKGASHTKGAIWSLPEQFAWVRDRLDGKPLTNVCKRGAATCCSLSDKPPCSP
jgi:acetyl esterase/lipase